MKFVRLSEERFQVGFEAGTCGARHPELTGILKRSFDMAKHAQIHLT